MALFKVKQGRDYFDLEAMLSAANKDEQDKPSGKGVFSKPSKGQQDPEVLTVGFLSDLFGRGDAYVKELQEDTLRSAEEAALSNMESGITKSLGEPARLKKLKEGESLVPKMRPEAGFVDADPLPKAIEERSPITEQELPPAETSGGLMSPVTKEEETTPTKEELIASVFKAEGGYSTDTKDSGNYYKGEFIGTNHGISAPVLAQYLGRKPTVKEMKALTKEKAKEIAGKRYYDRFEIDTLPSDVQEIVFHAVYMGESRGVRAMQNLMGITPDGKLGPMTKAAMKNADFTKQEYRDEYLRELQFGTEGYSDPSPSWNEHGKGWTNRYNKLAE